MNVHRVPGVKVASNHNVVAASMNPSQRQKKGKINQQMLKNGVKFFLHETCRQVKNPFYSSCVVMAQLQNKQNIKNRKGDIQKNISLDFCPKTDQLLWEHGVEKTRTYLSDRGTSIVQMCRI